LRERERELSEEIINVIIKYLIGKWISCEDFNVENLVFSEMSEVIINVTFTFPRRTVKVVRGNH